MVSIDTLNLQSHMESKGTRWTTYARFLTSTRAMYTNGSWQQSHLCNTLYPSQVTVYSQDPASSLRIIRKPRYCPAARPYVHRLHATASCDNFIDRVVRYHRDTSIMYSLFISMAASPYMCLSSTWRQHICRDKRYVSAACRTRNVCNGKVH